MMIKTNNKTMIKFVTIYNDEYLNYQDFSRDILHKNERVLYTKDHAVCQSLNRSRKKHEA